MIRLLLVDDHVPYSQNLRALLGQTADMEVVGVATTGEEALGLAETLVPNVALVDVLLPGINGIVTTRRLVAMQPAIKVLALSVCSERAFVDEMRKAGAQGYLLKESGGEVIKAAIRSVMSGSFPETAFPFDTTR